MIISDIFNWARDKITQTCTSLVDYSDQREWIRQKAILHPTEFPMLLGNRNIGCERIISDLTRRNCAIINETRDHDIRQEGETVNLKINRDKISFVGSDMHESKKKIEEKKLKKLGYC